MTGEQRILLASKRVFSPETWPKPDFSVIILTGMMRA